MTIKKQTYLLGVLCLAALLLTGCKTEGEVVAKVNRTAITDIQVEERIKSYPANLQASFGTEQGKQVIIEQLINEELLNQEAKRSGLAKNEDYIKQIEALEKQFEDAKKQALVGLLLREKVDSQIKLTNQDVINYYNNNPKLFEAYEKRRAKHILVKTEAEAKKIQSQLRNGASFDRLAQEKSIDPTGKSSGDLGWFKKGDLVPEFEKAAYAIPRVGRTSGIVKTQFGYHIIKLTDVEKVAKRELADVQNQLQQTVYNQQRTSILSDYLNTLKTNHKVTKIEAKNEG